MPNPANYITSNFGTERRDGERADAGAAIMDSDFGGIKIRERKTSTIARATRVEKP